jgi:hypothetical protein
MNRLKIARKTKENKIIWKHFKAYINFCVLICFLIIIFNLHPIQYETYENQKILYIFHDYAWNEYLLNDDVHSAADSMEYLFDTSVPEQIKWEDSPKYTDYVSLWAKWNNTNQTWDNNNDTNITKDNQVSFDEIISDLWVDWENKDNTISINIDNSQSSPKDDENSYSISKEDNGSTLIIEKETKNEDSNTNETENDKIGQKFSYITEWWILPILVPWEELSLTEYNDNEIIYDNNQSNNSSKDTDDNNKSGWITIIKDYADCMTPRWYKISHGDSVLAYKQIDNAPDICNIERRYCRNWKLSWTFTQQGCSINSNYSYELKWEVNIPQQAPEEIKWWARQNPDWTVSVKSDEIWWWFVFDKPNRTSTDFSYSDNLTYEDEWIEQTERPHRNCTTPRWEKVKHGQFIQAFKHENWFSDAPCEAQFRLCSMWELLWTYTESTCKTWDTSFIDWINGSPTWKTYSKEKLDLIKKQIKDEEKYYKDSRKTEWRVTNSIALDKILYILDED